MIDRPPGAGKRIILTAMGSLGDMHPYLAIGLGLRARGHEVTVATGEFYRAKVEALGFGFRPLRPNVDVLNDPAAMRRFMDPRWGTFRILRELILPNLRATFEDTDAAVAATRADLLVSHALAYAAPLVAERRGVAWVSTQVTPIGLFSAHDPPLVPGFPAEAGRLRPLGPAFWWVFGRALRRATRPWAAPIRRLRAEVGLRPAGGNPLVDGHSPGLVLALFSPLLAPKQPDWPPQVVHTGFPWFDGASRPDLPAELSRFLDDGPPPVVFTLGDSGAMVAGTFFEESVAAARRLGRRAVLITGRGPRGVQGDPTEGAIALGYAPFSALFPRACALVHAGGIGTSGLALRAGRPMLVAPHAHDQPDNAARLARLGVARVISPRRYSSPRVESELHRLLDEPAYAQRAAEVGGEVAREDGVRVACDALERRLGFRAQAQVLVQPEGIRWAASPFAAREHPRPPGPTPTHDRSHLGQAAKSAKRIGKVVMSSIRSIKGTQANPGREGTGTSPPSPTTSAGGERGSC